MNFGQIVVKFLATRAFDFPYVKRKLQHWLSNHLGYLDFWGCTVRGRRTLAAMVVFLAAGTASAQQWAESLFTAKTHDFGAVARAAKVEHVFVLKNNTSQKVHIASVRSSCGCTQPRVGKDWAAPGESASVVAAFNTRGFTGKRGAWVTVTLDKPQYAEVRLRIDGYIRTDVVLDPGQVALGSVGVGQTAEKTVKVNYAGRNDWKIENVKTNSPYLEARVIETARANGRVSYNLVVELKPDAPVGYINDKLVLQTNDRRATQVPVKVEGLVVANLTVSPSPLLLGTVQPGQSVKRQLIIKGTKPFRILEIVAEDNGFSFEPSDTAKLVHVVPITFEAGVAGQTLDGKIVVRTDMTEAPTASVTVKGQVAAPFAGN